MMLSPWHRRRAERLAQLLDEASGGRRHRVRSPHDDELGQYVALRHRLAAEAEPQVDPEFRAGLRAMLVANAQRQADAAAEAATGDRANPVPRQRPLRRPAGTLARGPRARTAIITGVTVGAVAFAGMSTASANAVPGDALYGVKRSTERAQLALAGSDVGRAQLYLDFARTRLAEAGTVSGGDLDRVLGDMDRDTTAGIRLLTTAAATRRDRAALDPIDPFVADQRATLTELAAGADRGDLDRVDASLGLLDQISERAADLRRDLELGCHSATSIDALGPEPERCYALPAPSAPRTAQPPPGSSGGGPPPDWQGDDAAGAGEQPDAGSARDENDDPGEPGAGDRTGPDADTGPAPTEPADESNESDGGLINGLNRLLGNLLGG